MAEQVKAAAKEGRGAASIEIACADTVLSNEKPNDGSGHSSLQTTKNAIWRFWTRFERSNTSSTLPKRVLLLYLNRITFQDTDQTVAKLVKQALDLQIPLALAHEQDEQKGGCAFSLFFEQTPKDLQDAPYKLFDTLAVPLFSAQPELCKISLRHLLRQMGGIEMIARMSDADPASTGPTFQDSVDSADDVNNNDQNSVLGMPITCIAGELQHLQRRQIAAEGAAAAALPTAVSVPAAQIFAGDADSQQGTPEAVLHWLDGLMQSERVTPHEVRQAMIDRLTSRSADDGTISDARLREHLSTRFENRKVFAVLSDLGFAPVKLPLQEPASLGCSPMLKLPLQKPASLGLSPVAYGSKTRTQEQRLSSSASSPREELTDLSSGVQATGISTQSPADIMLEMEAVNVEGMQEEVGNCRPQHQEQ